MSVMVTGGAGFIGNRIIRKLVERGEEVVCFDAGPPRGNLESLLDRIAVYRGNIMRIDQLLEAVNRHNVDRIIHMAALLPPETEDRPATGMAVNIDGCNNVFRGRPLGQHQARHLRQQHRRVRRPGHLRRPASHRGRPARALSTCTA